MRIIRGFCVGWLVITSHVGLALSPPAEVVDLLEISLEDLLKVRIKTASGIEENSQNAPAASIVVSAQEIEERGYTNLGEILTDLPGFDVIRRNGASYTVAYQRGYRTPHTERTLLTVNGIMNNHLWSRNAILSQQYPISGIERVEVLYGPSSAVYGPNAFLGIVNIVTKEGQSLENNSHQVQVTGQFGSFNSRALELSTQGHWGHLSYNLSARVFDSEGPDLEDYPTQWGYTTSDWLNNSQVWGPVLNLGNNGVQYGDYHNPAHDWGVFADIHYKNFTLGLQAWDQQDGYGLYYPFDRTQPNSHWRQNSYQYYLQHRWEVTPQLNITTLGLYREADIGTAAGDYWVEAVPDYRAGMQDYSFLSLSDWNSENDSWLFKQDYDYKWNDIFRLTGGIKYEFKDLTRAFEVCYYWTDAYCSLADPTDQGPYNLGPGIFHSSDPTIAITPVDVDEMEDENRVNTTDVGGYLQGIWDFGAWRLHNGIRYDRNSVYGASVNPRVSIIHRLSDDKVLKLIYGSAFQEPQPELLWGGWSGRRANPNLKPGKARNLELIFMYNTEHWLHDISLFTAHYRNVIKEDAENIGTQDTYGLEYRGRYSFNNFIKQAPAITGYTYYTFTQSRSSIHYDHTLQQWVDGEDDLGDIAPHKLNLGITIPFSARWSLNLRGNYVSQRELYSRNPLHAEGKEAEAYTTFHLNLGYRKDNLTASFKVLNLFDHGYLVPGMEQANSGDDFDQRSGGFQNSMLPQPGRQWLFNLSWKF